MWVVLKTVAIAKVIAKASAGVCEAEVAGREGAWCELASLAPSHLAVPRKGEAGISCLSWGGGGWCTTISFVKRALLLKAIKREKLLQPEQCFSDINVRPDHLGTL